MSGRSGKILDKTAGGKTSRSTKANLHFPVGRIHRKLRKSNYADRIGSGAPIFLAAVLEYLCAEVLELAGNAARENKKLRINPRHIMLAVQTDEELSKLFERVTISQGGVMQHINTILLPKKTSNGPSQSTEHYDSQEQKNPMAVKRPLAEAHENNANTQEV
ncbi:putative Histone H2AX [Hypsibius exemplaris]|uniref:Histone H2A n=1 Tax=Hypsibius exemplaris TaxID=2072580 RepID=A0A1W0WS61_HYPEX|nr:putative Histone H2AX [Hypsibius exemplaris]